MRPRLLAWAIVINRAFCAPAMGQSAAEEHVTPATTSAANAVGTPPQSPAIAPVAGDNLQRADENGGAPKITPAPQKPEPQSEATSAAPESDHAGVVRRYAVGYLGFANIPFGALADLALTEPAEDSGRLARAPILGIRYWASPQWGIDAGVGFSMGSGSQNVTRPASSSSTRDVLLPRGVALHLGAPVALKARRHYVFEVIPELDLAYARLKIPYDSGGTEVIHSGVHLDVGMRAGAEIHFGFLGVSELSLTGSIGVRVDVNYLKTQDRSTQTTVTDTRAVLRSTLGSEPWDLFTGNVSAFYYL